MNKGNTTHLPCDSCDVSHEWCLRYREIGKTCCRECKHRLTDVTTAGIRDRLLETLAIESDQAGAYDDYLRCLKDGLVPPNDSRHLVKRTDMLLPVIKEEYTTGYSDGTREALVRVSNIIGAVRTALADLTIDRPEDRARADELILTLVGLECVITDPSVEDFDKIGIEVPCLKEPVGATAPPPELPFDEIVDATDAVAGPDRPKRRKWSKKLILKDLTFLVVAVTILTVLFRTFLFQAFYIPSSSMLDTLHVGDRVLVSRLTPRFMEVNRGDIVVFHDPDHWLEPSTSQPGSVGKAITAVKSMVGLSGDNEYLIKRVIGTSGDRVVCDEQMKCKVSVNGEELEESYLNPGSQPSERVFDVTVPEGHLFVMGDNRQNSGDSRYHLDDINDGFVPLDEVVGTAVVTIWPFSNMTVHHNPGHVFEDVPSP